MSNVELLGATIYSVKVRLIEKILGTVPKDRDIYTTFIASKAKKQAIKASKTATGETATSESMDKIIAEEAESIEEAEEKGWTGFMSDKNGVFIPNYMIRGHLKYAARTVKIKDEASKKGDMLRQLQDKITRCVFVRPKRLYLPSVSGNIERPLRGETSQGPRVSLARSDCVDEGAEIAFELHVMPGFGITEKVLRTLLAYGEYQGYGQWRGANYGQFELVEFAKKK